VPIQKFEASPALLEMLEKDMAAGIDPFAIPVPERAPAPPPTATFYIPL
jgi:hypothetical protein